MGNLLSMFSHMVGKGLPILIGFAWEQTFDSAAEGATEVMLPYVGKSFEDIIPFAFAIFIVFGVLPTWQTGIVPAMVEFEKVEEERKRRQSTRRSSSKRSTPALSHGICISCSEPRRTRSRTFTKRLRNKRHGT